MMALLATLTDLATIAGVRVDDPAAALSLRRASARFVEAVGWPVVLHTVAAVTLRGDGGPSLRIPALNVVEASASIDGTPVDGLVLDARLGVLHNPSGWPRGMVEVGWTAGWAESDIPAGIQDAVLEQAVALLTAQRHQGARRITRGPFTYDFTNLQVGVTAAWQAAVERYSVGGDWS